MKARAAILEQSNAPLVVDEIEVPRLECGQVLVRIAVSGICGAQLGEIAAVKGPDKFLPHLLGHEGGGVVEEIGPGVTHVKAATGSVCIGARGSAFRRNPPSTNGADRTVHAGWVTTFNEYAVVSENRVTPIPKDIGFDIAALMGCAVTTALGLINNRAKAQDRPISGGLRVRRRGAELVQGAAIVAADPIIAVDIYDRKLELPGSLARPIAQSARALISARRFAKSLDHKAWMWLSSDRKVSLIETAYELTAPQGRDPGRRARHDEDITIHSLPLHFGKALTGCEGGQSRSDLDIPRYLKCTAQGS